MSESIAIPSKKSKKSLYQQIHETADEYFRLRKSLDIEEQKLKLMQQRVEDLRDQANVKLSACFKLLKRVPLEKNQGQSYPTFIDPKDKKIFLEEQHLRFDH